MKRPSLPYLRWKTAKGRVYAYVERAGERTRLDPDAPGFLQQYEEAVRGRARPAGKRTWANLIARYRQDEQFTRLKPRTREDYDGVMVYIIEKFGDLDPAKIKTKTIYEIMEALRKNYRFANYVKQVMSILLNFAIKIGWAETNPARGVANLKRPAKEDQNRPWPPEVVEAFAAHADARGRLVFELAYGTGQRIGDVLALRWSDLRDGEFHVTQGKTGTALVIPITARLRRYLDGVERSGEHILARNLRQPLSYRQAYDAVQRGLRKAELSGWTIHGLRYTAAAELAALGATDDEIAAITGHQSVAMVRKYAGDARQRARARSAQRRRDGQNRNGPNRET